MDIEALENNPEQCGFSSLALEGGPGGDEAVGLAGILAIWGIGSVMLKQRGLDAAGRFMELKFIVRTGVDRLRCS